MDRYCKDCNDKLIIGTNWAEYMKKNWNYKCKSCYSKQIRKQQLRFEDGLFSVYILPESNYAGVTKNIYTRMGWHITRKNATTRQSYRILYKTKDYYEALELEALLHDLGYKGRHIYAKR